jgi:two-component system nitrate/nitrite response regulator NarL
MATRALVADDDAFARRLISDALRRGDVEVVAEARDGAEAIRLCLEHRPDVVVMDLMMPVVDGIAATREIVNSVPDQRVIVLTSSDEEDLGILALRAGAVGFLSKDLDTEALPKSVQAALHGEAAISRRLSLRVIEQIRGGIAPSIARPLTSTLTAREWEVVDLLNEGRGTAQIADALVITRETVRSHVKHILRKLGASSREEAVELAQQFRTHGDVTAAAG